MKFLAVIFCAIAMASAMTIYNKSKIYRVVIETEEQFNIMENWKYDLSYNFIVLSLSEHHANIKVEPEFDGELVELLKSNGFKYTYIDKTDKGTVNHDRN